MLLSVLAVLLVFGIIVLVHEWGHMMAAKACGVAVPDFAIGMGPSLFSFRLGETRYHICALPIGGFVRIAGLEGDDALPRTRGEVERMTRDAREIPAHLEAGEPLDSQHIAAHIVDHAVEETVDPDPQPARRWRTWRDLGGWQKAFILIGGPAMNFILAFVIILAMGFIGFPDNAVMIAEVSPGSPAAAAGLQPGDVITHVEDRRVSNSRQFSAIVGGYADQELALSVRRAETSLTLLATPSVIEGYNSGRVSLGVALAEAPSFTNEINLIQPKTRADETFDTAAGERMKLSVGDRVVALNGQPVANGYELLSALATFDLDSGAVTEPLEQAVNITVLKRDGARHTIELPADLSMLTLGIGFRPELHRLPPAQALTRSMEDAYAYAVSMLYGMKMLFTSPDVGKTISGPVGIMRIIGQSAQSDVHTFLLIFMIINLNLGLINLLPLPALDGGRLVFVALNGIGLRIHEKREALVHAMGMVMLLGLIVLITVGDVTALFR